METEQSMKLLITAGNVSYVQRIRMQLQQFFCIWLNSLRPTPYSQLKATQGKPHLLMSQFPSPNHLLQIDSQLCWFLQLVVMVVVVVLQQFVQIWLANKAPGKAGKVKITLLAGNGWQFVWLLPLPFWPLHKLQIRVGGVSGMGGMGGMVVEATLIWGEIDKSGAFYASFPIVGKNPLTDSSLIIPLQLAAAWSNLPQISIKRAR